MDSHKCPISKKIFEDPVIADDGYTYERRAIEDYIKQHGISPLTAQSMSIDTLKTNHTVKKIIDESKSHSNSQYQFELDVDIRKIQPRPLFQAFGKSIYKIEWINRNGPDIILLKIDGAKANQEASFYVQLSCHPYIVRTYGFVKNNQRAIMLLQEYASQGDLSELLQENQFKPNERVLLKIFEQICDAMICLTDNNIVHGDLACRNVLVFQSDINDPKKNLVKLTDFGLTQESKLYSIINSAASTIMTIIPIRYAAPEILLNSNKKNYSEKSDIYSMGVLMWEACSYGELPYSHVDNDNDVRQMKLNNERLSRPSLCSDELWNIINECWHLDPQNRPDFQTLKQSILTLEFQETPKPKSTIISKEEPIKSTITHSPIEIKKYMSCNNMNQISDLLTPVSSLKISPKVDQSKCTQINENKSKTMFLCECGKQYTSQLNLDQHKIKDCRNRFISCTFCDEKLSSSDAMHDHLEICGNKRESCPNCNKLIRRAILSYHFYNNCINLNENDIFIEQHSNSLQTNLNNNNNQEKKSIPNWLLKQQEKKLALVTCDDCHNQFLQKDYINHKDICSKDNMCLQPSTQKHQISSTNDQDNTDHTVRVICDLCKESISLLQFLSHKKNCPKRKTS